MAALRVVMRFWRPTQQKQTNLLNLLLSEVHGTKKFISHCCNHRPLYIHPLKIKYYNYTSFSILTKRLSADNQSQNKPSVLETLKLSENAAENNKNTSKTQTENESKDTGTDENGNKKKESWWRGKNSWRLGLILLGTAVISWGVGLISIWGAPQEDPEGKEISDEYSDLPTFFAYLRRTWKEMNIFKKKIQDPSRDKLLPDPLKYPYMQPPYTLALELTGVLIHPDWTYGTGWRFKKRPGIEYFLQQIGPPLFEVVIYSSESGMTADPLINHLDPQGFIMYRLYRDATRYMDGHHVKDLSCLNRDLSKIIMLDCNPESVKLQKPNALVLKKWDGQDDDRTLIELAHFLKTIAVSGVDDVRPVLDYYNKFDDPLAAFRENQKKLQEEEEARANQMKLDAKKKSWLSGFTKK